MRTLLLEGPGPFCPETLLGALCDLGASPSAVEWELGKLYLAAYHLHFERDESGGGVRFTAHPGAVHTHDQDDDDDDDGPARAHAAHEHEPGDGHHHHHHDGNQPDDGDDDHHGHEGEETVLADVVELIGRSDLSPFVAPRAAAALGQLGDDFDEDTALVAVVGVVGSLAALEALEVGNLFCDVHLFPKGLDRVSKALLDALGFRPVPPGSVRLRAQKTGVGLGRRAGEALRATLGEPA